MCELRDDPSSDPLCLAADPSSALRDLDDAAEPDSGHAATNRNSAATAEGFAGGASLLPCSLLLKPHMTEA